MGGPDRTRLQVQTALASVATLLTDVAVEIAGRGRGMHLWLVGDPLQPPLADQLQHLTGVLRAAGDGTGRAFGGSLIVRPVTFAPFGLGRWVPLLPGSLRARLTAQAAVEFITEFLDARLGVGGWVGAGCAVRTRVRDRQVEVVLVPWAGGSAVRLPPLPVAPFQRRRPGG